MVFYVLSGRTVHLEPEAHRVISKQWRIKIKPSEVMKTQVAKRTLNSSLEICSLVSQESPESHLYLKILGSGVLYCFNTQVY